MAYFYLVADKKTGKGTHLAECSSPSVAIADAAKDMFTAQRVEGAVLDALKATMDVRKIGKDAEPATPPADSKDGQQEQQPGQTGGDDDNQPPADGDKGAKGKGGE